MLGWPGILWILRYWVAKARISFITSEIYDEVKLELAGIGCMLLLDVFMVILGVSWFELRVEPLYPTPCTPERPKWHACPGSYFC